ncbi:MAG: hypothetical protein JRN20_06400 [Nitrososphaerota archaeon]|nr:hypothetical protein [Nitrososphaerota archaeon]
MLVDLQLSKRKTLAIIFDQEQLSARVSQLADARCSELGIITSSDATKNDVCGDARFVEIVEVDDRRRVLEITEKIILSFIPFLTLISTGEHYLDKRIAGIAKQSGSLVYVVDSPKLNDLNMPAVAKLGEDVRVAISTGGKSPAMARMLRRRIEKIIGRDDLLQVKLQGHLRKEIRRSERDPVKRKRMIYQLLRDKTIKSLLRQDRFEDATRIGLERIKRSR